MVFENRLTRPSRLSGLPRSTQGCAVCCAMGGAALAVLGFKRGHYAQGLLRRRPRRHGSWKQQQMQRPRGKHLGPVWSADGRPGAGGGAHGEAAAARCSSKPAVTLQATKPPLALRQGGCHVKFACLSTAASVFGKLQHSTCLLAQQCRLEGTGKRCFAGRACQRLAKPLWTAHNEACRRQTRTEALERRRAAGSASQLPAMLRWPAHVTQRMCSRRP